MPTILTFGDSNTHGTTPMPSRDHNARFGFGTRWPTVMAEHLGPDWHVVEDGLPGRTTQHDDPAMWPNMNGQTGLRMALASHQPLDVVAIMLGTNDLKTRFAPSVEKITAGAAGLLDIALTDDLQARHGPFRVLLICPPPVVETGPIRGEFTGAGAIAPNLTRAYADLAHARGAAFLDAGTVISVSDTDGVHFDAPAHRTLGEAVAEAVRSL